MTISSISTVEDIREYIKKIVKAHKPDANLEKGFPLYDLLIEPFAQVIYNEREYVNITSNIARVLPLFDDEGDLLYPEYEDYLLNKYFIGIEDIDRTLYTIYFYFDKKCDFYVKPGSTITYNNVTFNINPTVAIAADTEWSQDARGHYFPVQVYSSDNSDSITGSTDAWDVTSINLEISPDPEYGDAELLFVFNSSTISTTFTPIVTLDILKNSISNRSFSNPRAIRYHIDTNSGFYQSSLIQYKILKYADKHYVDTYKTLVDSGGDFSNVKVSGKGKVLLDYGIQNYVTPITMEYLTESSNYYFSEHAVISNDSQRQIQTLYLTGANYDSMDGEYLYWEIATVAAIPNIVFYDGSAVEVARGICPAATGGYTTVNQVGGSGISGYAYIKWKVDVAYNILNKVAGLNAPIYKFPFNNDRGVLAPVALFYNSNTATSLLEANLLKTDLDNNDSSLVITEERSTPVFFDNGFFTVESDTYSQIEWIELEGLSVANSDFYTLYWSKGVSGTLDFYSDPSMGTAYKVAEASLAGLNAAPPYITVAISQYNNSGITGNASLINSNADNDTDNIIYPKSNVVGFDNNNLFIKLFVKTGSEKQYHNQTCYMVYKGTNNTYLESAQAIFSDDDNREITSGIEVGPMKGMLFTLYYNSDYVMPYKANSTANQAKYEDLLEELESYFSTYSGNISDIDFQQLSSDIFATTGMYFLKLDYTVPTQRGHLVTGTIDLNDEDYASLDWATHIQTELTNGIDAAYYALAPLKEAVVTVEKIYKPVLVRASL